MLCTGNSVWVILNNNLCVCVCVGDEDDSVYSQLEKERDGSLAGYLCY